MHGVPMAFPIAMILVLLALVHQAGSWVRARF